MYKAVTVNKDHNTYVSKVKLANCKLPHKKITQCKVKSTPGVFRIRNTQRTHQKSGAHSVDNIQKE